MARVNVEQTAFTDSRFVRLGRLLGTNRWDAIGRMTLVWNECQERETDTLSVDAINALHDGLDHLADDIVTAGLGRCVDGEEGLSIYVCGAAERVYWLQKKRVTGRKNGTKGGRPKQPPVNQDRLPSETPPAPAPAPAPALEKKKTPSESKKKASAEELVEALTLDDELRAYAQSYGLDPDSIFENWRLRCRGNGYKVGRVPIADARSALMYFIRNNWKAKHDGNGKPISRKSARDFGQRTVAEVLADRPVHPVQDKAPGGPDDPMRPV